jgi:hypothetical protein
VAARIASLEAEVARLKAARSNDADQVAEMLVRIADAERAKAAAEQRALASDHRAEILGEELNRERARGAEADMWETSGTDDVHHHLDESLRKQAQLERAVALAREAMGQASALLEEFDRREEMAAGIRSRAVEQIRRALGGEPITAGVYEPPSGDLPIEGTPVRSLRESMSEPEPLDGSALELDLSE